jgi:hypothetical protein
MIPVVDLESVDLGAVRAGAGELGAIQAVNHGVPDSCPGTRSGWAACRTTG